MIAIILIIISVIENKFKLSSDKPSSSLAVELSQEKHVPFFPSFIFQGGPDCLQKGEDNKK